MKSLTDTLNESLRPQDLKIIKKVKELADEWVKYERRGSLSDVIAIEDTASKEKYYALQYTCDKLNSIIGVNSAGEVRSVGMFNVKDVISSENRKVQAMYYIDFKKLRDIIGSYPSVNNMISIIVEFDGVDIESFIEDLLYELEVNGLNHVGDHEIDDDDIRECITSNIKYTLL